MTEKEATRSRALPATRPDSSTLCLLLTAPGKLQVVDDPLPPGVEESHVVLDSLANIRCSSDDKARLQFTRHARIPNDAKAVALGHECVFRVRSTPPGLFLSPGDIVLLTPAHTMTPHDAKTLRPQDKGSLLALGYSYRYLGGLRRESALPLSLRQLVSDEGFGELFVPVLRTDDASLGSLAHAEAFGCCANALRHIMTRSGNEVRYGIPEKARIAFLGGTARMAMVTLTMIASLPTRPRVVAITGSPKKLERVRNAPPLEALRRRGVSVDLIERSGPNTLKRLKDSGPFDVVFTNFASKEVYDQAVEGVVPGGNVNNFAGAADESLSFSVRIPRAVNPSSLTDEARLQTSLMLHPAAPSRPERRSGVGKRVLFVNFALERLRAYLEAFPEGVEIEIAGPRDDFFLRAQFPRLRFPSDEKPLTDLFIARTGGEAASSYACYEARLARGAAVNFVDGATTIEVRSKRLHYETRHQLCGLASPFFFTNTSEPVSSDLSRQAECPIDFDWLVRGVSGLREATKLYDEVAAGALFGSFLVLPEFEDFPFVKVNALSFGLKRTELRHVAAPEVLRALEAGEDVLRQTGDHWSRALEEALYEAFGRTHPLAGGVLAFPTEERQRKHDARYQ